MRAFFWLRAGCKQCPASTIVGRSPLRTAHDIADGTDRAGVTAAVIQEVKVRTGWTTNGHQCSACLAADPDERRTRGPHSIIEDGKRHLQPYLRHTPRRSNLASSLRAVKRRWNRFSQYMQSRLERFELAAPHSSCWHREFLSSRQYGPGHARIFGCDSHDRSPVAAPLGQRRGPSTDNISFVRG